MAISYTEPLQTAWRTMRRTLFEPFDLGRWFTIGFAAWLAYMGTGGGGINIPSIPDRSGGAGMSQMLALFKQYAMIIIPIAAFLVLLGVTVGIVLLWASSRAEFMFVDNLVTNKAEVRDPWRRYRAQGNSLFVWRLLFGILVFVVVAVLVVALVVPLIPFFRGGHHPALSAVWITAIVGLAFAILAVALLAAYVNLFLRNFVVSIMYKRAIMVLPAWREFLCLLAAQPGTFIVFGLFVLLIHAATGLAALLVLVLTCCLCCLGCLLMVPYIGTVIMLPLFVFFRAYGIHFLAQFGPDYDLFCAAALPAAAPAAMPTAPAVPPPLPAAEPDTGTPQP